MKNTIVFFVIILFNYYPSIIYSQVITCFYKHQNIGDSIVCSGKQYTYTPPAVAIAKLPYIRDSIIGVQKTIEKNNMKKLDLLLKYANYIQSTDDKVLKLFLENDNYLENYSCYLSPLVHQLRTVNFKYCNEVIEYIKKLFVQYKINLHYTNEINSVSPENILPLSQLEYTYEYDSKRSLYKNNPNGRCVNYIHECLIVDVLKHDKENGLMFLLTFNSPGKYYSIFLYDYIQQIIVPEIQFLKNIDVENLKKHRGKTYFMYWANQLFVYAKDCKIQKITDTITLFVLYDKMKIPFPSISIFKETK